MTKPEDWVIKYDQANYQSGAGKAVRQLMQIVNEAERETIEAKRLLLLVYDHFMDERMFYKTCQEIETLYPELKPPTNENI